MAAAGVGCLYGKSPFPLKSSGIKSASLSKDMSPRRFGHYHHQPTSRKEGERREGEGSSQRYCAAGKSSARRLWIWGRAVLIIFFFLWC